MRGPLALAPWLMLAVIALPVLAGLAGTLLPAFGYLPALGGTALSLEPFAMLLGKPGMVEAIFLSIWTGLAATVISLALTFAFIAGWSESKTFQRLRALLSPLLSIPHAAAALGIAVLLAPSGPLFRLIAPVFGWDAPPDLLTTRDPYGLALIFGLVVKEVPFLFLMSLAALPQTMPRRKMRIARAAGYGEIAGFTFAVLPALYRQIRLPVFAVLAFSVSVVDVAMILGPNLPATLAICVLDLMRDPDLDARFMAAAGAALLMGLTLLLILLWLAGERVTARLMRPLAASGRRFPRDRAARLLAMILMLASTAAIFLGLALLALWSVAGPWRWPDILPANLTLRGWMRVMPDLMPVLAETVLIAGLSAGAALILVLLSLEALRRGARLPRLHGLMFLPLIVPQLAFLFGLQTSFIRFGLDGTTLAVAFAHLIFVLPYVWLSLSGPWAAYDRRIDKVGAALGASPWRIFWRLRLPILLRPILIAFAIGLAVSIGQYLPTLLIGAGRIETLTTQAVALSAGGNRQVIGVWALWQTLLPFLGFALAAALPYLMENSRNKG
ncbi:ABC transporter permease [Paracoccaceae bacterium GXU_MW_L88]